MSIFYIESLTACNNSLPTMISTFPDHGWTRSELFFYLFLYSFNSKDLISFIAFLLLFTSSRRHTVPKKQRNYKHHTLSLLPTK